MKTQFQSSKDLKRNWLIVDADGVTLGKIASKVASLLRGKHKPTYSPHTNDGDFVVVINSKKVRLTGNKLNDKMYYRHSGYVGSIKGFTYKELMEKDSNFVIKKAVKGMLSNNRLGRAQLGSLRVYEQSEHQHSAQKPTKIDI